MKTARQAALEILARGALPSGKLREKLANKGYAAAEIEDALAFCTERRYLDDAAYARRAWERGTAKGYAGFALERKLIAAGLEPSAARAARTEAEEDGGDTAVLDRLLQKIHKAERPWDAAERRRCLAGLSRRGFAYSAAAEAVSRAADTTETERNSR